MYGRPAPPVIAPPASTGAGRGGQRGAVSRQASTAISAPARPPSTRRAARGDQRLLPGAAAALAGRVPTQRAPASSRFDVERSRRPMVQGSGARRSALPGREPPGRGAGFGARVKAGLFAISASSVLGQVAVDRHRPRPGPRGGPTRAARRPSGRQDDSRARPPRASAPVGQGRPPSAPCASIAMYWSRGQVRVDQQRRAIEPHAPRRPANQGSSPRRHRPPPTEIKRRPRPRSNRPQRHGDVPAPTPARQPPDAAPGLSLPAAPSASRCAR